MGYFVVDVFRNWLVVQQMVFFFFECGKNLLGHYCSKNPLLVVNNMLYFIQNVLIGKAIFLFVFGNFLSAINDGILTL